MLRKIILATAILTALGSFASADVKTTDRAPGEIAWGKAMNACFARDKHANRGCHVHVAKDGRLAGFCPGNVADAKSIVDGCSVEANTSVKPTKWTEK